MVSQGLLRTSDGRMSVIAHRGGRGTWRENTLEAFAGARSMGADGVELDARLTRDGLVVVHHDDEARIGPEDRPAPVGRAPRVAPRPGKCDLRLPGPAHEHRDQARRGGARTPAGRGEVQGARDRRGRARVQGSCEGDRLLVLARCTRVVRRSRGGDPDRAAGASGPECPKDPRGGCECLQPGVLRLPSLLLGRHAGSRRAQSRCEASRWPPGPSTLLPTSGGSRRRESMP